MRENNRLLAQDNAQEWAVDLKPAVVLDEAQFLEFIHEEINPGARRSDCLCQRFLRNLGKNPLRPIILSIASRQQQRASQPFLGGVE
jgi:hypothetical protein